MSQRQVIILWTIAILLGIIVAAVTITQQNTGDSATNRKAGETLFEDFPAEQVARITIEGVTNAVTLAKDGDQWVVANRDNYPARTASVYEFIRMIDELKVTRGIEAGPSFAPRFGMDESANNSIDRGITATFEDANGNPLATITLGKNIESNSASAGTPLGGGGMVGRYIRNHDDASGFYAINQLFPSISYHPETWLSDDFINPEKIRAITLGKPDSSDPAWTVTRESEEAEFQLAGAKPNEVLNTSNAAPLKNLFAYTRFQDVVPQDQVAKRTKPEGRQIATIQTFEGFTYTLTITPEQGVDDRYLMQVDVQASLPAERRIPEGETDEEAIQRDEAFTKRLNSLTQKLEQAKTFEGRTYQVSESTLSPLLKKRSDLVVDATVPETEAPAVNTQP